MKAIIIIIIIIVIIIIINAGMWLVLHGPIWYVIGGWSRGCPITAVQFELFVTG